MNAPEILKKAAQHMEARAATYDTPGGERSMAQTVAIFNLFHGTALTEVQGWHFMQILKDVRLFARPGTYHADSGEDGTAYAALKCEAMDAQAESVHAATAPVVIPPAPDYLPDSVAIPAQCPDPHNAANNTAAQAALDVVAVNSADDGWIEWGGGECPVDPDACVDVVVRGGEKRSYAVARILRWRWASATIPLNPAADIVKYRVVK